MLFKVFPKESDIHNEVIFVSIFSHAKRVVETTNREQNEVIWDMAEFIHNYGRTRLIKYNKKDADKIKFYLKNVIDPILGEGHLPLVLMLNKLKYLISDQDHHESKTKFKKYLKTLDISDNLIQRDWPEEYKINHKLLSKMIVELEKGVQDGK